MALNCFIIFIQIKMNFINKALARNTWRGDKKISIKYIGTLECITN